MNGKYSVGSHNCCFSYHNELANKQWKAIFSSPFPSSFSFCSFSRKPNIIMQLMPREFPFNVIFFVASMYFELHLLVKFEIWNSNKYIHVMMMQVFLFKLVLLIAWFIEFVDIYWLPSADWLVWKRVLRKMITLRYCILPLYMWLLQFPFWDYCQSEIP